MLNAVAYLIPRHGEQRNVMVGQKIREPLTPAESSWPLRATTGEGMTIEPALVPYGEGLALEWGPINQARAVPVSIGSTIRMFTANIDPAESRLTSVDRQAFLTTLDRPVRWLSGPPASARTPSQTADSLSDPGGKGRFAELVDVVMYIVLGLVFLEMGMAMWFGGSVAGEASTAERSS